LFDFETYRNRKRTFQSIALKIHSPIPLPKSLSRKSDTNSSSIKSITASDGSNLAYRIWHGASNGSVVLYLHGIEGHSQWFEPTARVLSENGITIYAPDRRGAGLNSENRGHLATLQIFIGDVEQLLQQIRSEHPTQPIFLFANCWSAKAAALIARRDHSYADGVEPVKLAGIVITCPAIVTEVDFDLVTKLKIAFHSFAGEMARQRTWPIPLTTEMLTDNPLYIDYLQNDPLRLHAATASFYRETFVLGLLAQKSAEKIDLPLLLLQAEKDRIVDIEQVKKWYDRVSSKDKVWRLYSNATHNLDFDANWFDDYTNLLIDWLNEKTQGITRR
jgi:acylglycerol lipase